MAQQPPRSAARSSARPQVVGARHHLPDDSSVVDGRPGAKRGPVQTDDAGACHNHPPTPRIGVSPIDAEDLSMTPLESLVACGTKLWLDSVDPAEVDRNLGCGATG